LPKIWQEAQDYILCAQQGTKSYVAGSVGQAATTNSDYCKH